MGDGEMEDEGLRMHPKEHGVTNQRRLPIRGLAAATILITCLLVPSAIGIATLIPNQMHEPEFVFVTALSSVADDGIPHKFAVVAASQDAWTMSPKDHVADVFLLKTERGANLIAVDAMTAPLAIPVEYDKASGLLRDCCWGSLFRLDGTRVLPSPHAHDLGRYPVEVRRGEVCVRRFWGCDHPGS